MQLGLLGGTLASLPLQVSHPSDLFMLLYIHQGLVSATTTEQDGHQHKERHATASMPTVPAGPPPLASWRRQSEGGGHHDASHIPKPPLRVQKASPPRGPESVAGSGVLSPGSERKRQEALSLASTASPTKAPLESMLDKLPSSEALPGRPMPQRSTSQTGSHDSSRRETSPCRPSGRQLPPPMLIHSTSARNLLRGAVSHLIKCIDLLPCLMPAM